MRHDASFPDMSLWQNVTEKHIKIVNIFHLIKSARKHIISRVKKLGKFPLSFPIKVRLRDQSSTLERMVGWSKLD